MKVELAEKAGFCFGVNRAVDTVYREAGNGIGPVYTYGPIIHNEVVTSDLEDHGVTVIHSLKEVSEKEKGIIVIRSHGVSQQEYLTLKESNLSVVDATCPFVKKIHDLVHTYSKEGYYVIIIGSSEHPEVQGILGWSVNPDRTTVIATEEEARNLKIECEKKICIVAQTTFNFKKFQELVEIIREKSYIKVDSVDDDRQIAINNTICSATKERQEAARQLSCNVDAMIVIGGLNSSNTKKLYEICSENCQNTYFIQTKEDLGYSDLSRFDYVGITAGASTPNNIIEEVQKYVRDEL